MDERSQELSELVAEIRQRDVPGLMEAWKSDPVQGQVAAEEELVARGGGAAVEALLRELENPDTSWRGLAALLLGRIGDPQALPALRRTLSDPEWSVQQRSALALIRWAEPAAVDWLQAHLLDSMQWSDRFWMAHALQDAGYPVIERLLPGLTLNDPEVRASTAYVLGTLGNPRVVDALIRTLQEDPEGTVRLYAAIGLGELGATAAPALPALESAVAHDTGHDWQPWQTVREAAAAAVQKIKERLGQTPEGREGEH